MSQGVGSKLYLAPLVCIVLMAGLGVQRILFHLPVGDATPYHASVRRAVEAIPDVVGDWQGEDEPVPAAATQLLRPNIILARRFLNPESGLWATLLIVHCRDARDMGGHFPRVCYPANGWTPCTPEETDRTWNIQGLEISGREYHFESGGLEQTNQLIVYNFILRPDGLIERDVSGLREAGYDPRKKPFGGGQVQVIFDGALGAEDRESAFETLISACMPAIRTVLSGSTK